MRSQSFHDYIVYGLLASNPGITSRAMFSGWGLYKNGLIFGIIVGETLYCKFNKHSRKIFEKLESAPFTYQRKNGKTISMSYWSVPEELRDDRKRLYELVELSSRK